MPYIVIKARLSIRIISIDYKSVCVASIFPAPAKGYGLLTCPLTHLSPLHPQSQHTPHIATTLLTYLQALFLAALSSSRSIDVGLAVGRSYTFVNK